jgi:hypothetical protein
MFLKVHQNLKAENAAMFFKPAAGEGSCPSPECISVLRVLPKLIQWAMRADTDATSKNLWRFYSSLRYEGFVKPRIGEERQSRHSTSADLSKVVEPSLVLLVFTVLTNRSEIEAFGKNEQVKKVFWTFFISMAGLVLARVVDPATAQQIVGLITGMGG